jgi:hypothetical protein
MPAATIAVRIAVEDIMSLLFRVQTRTAASKVQNEEHARDDCHAEGLDIHADSFPAGLPPTWLLSKNLIN